MIRWKATSKFYRNEMMDVLDLKDNLLNHNALRKDGEALYKNIWEMLDNEITEFYIHNRVAKLYD